MSWQLASLLVVGLALGAGFAWYERTRPSSRVLALVATLVAMGVLGRLAFAPLPNVKPATTDVIFFAGFVLGAAPGLVTGAITALVSNFFISQGSWTPWQMAAWGIVGLFGAALGRVAGRDLGRWPLACACAAAGLLFGAVMNTYQWTFAGGQNLATWLAISGQSLPFDAAHAIGNFLFCLALGPAFVRSIARYRRRFQVSWPAPATAAAPVLLAVACLGALAFAPSARASTASRAVEYLVGAQNRDGGFGPAPGTSSNTSYSGWAGLGLAAGGIDLASARHGGPSMLDYTRTTTAGSNDLGDIERTILVLHASAISPRHFGRRDLVAALLSHCRGDSSFDGSINWTAFGILAMAASGAGSPQSSAAWLGAQQNRDGGFGPAPHSTSDVDDTGAVLEALAAAGTRGGPVVDRAVGFIAGAQNGDGGMGQYPGYGSNSQSSAWAVQGLIAIGRDPSSVQRGGRTALAYIASLQQGDGSIRYSRSSTQTPVFVTAQAIAALERKAFPLSPPRAAQVRAARARSAGGGRSKGKPGGGNTADGRAGSASAAAREALADRRRRIAAGAVIRRAAQPIDGDTLPSASLILFIAGGTMLLTGLGGVWRAQRRT